MKKVIEFSCFLIILAISFALPYGNLHIPLRILTALLTVFPAVLLYRSNIALFVPGLFFVINALVSPSVLIYLQSRDIHVPQLFLLPAIVLYLLVLARVKHFRKYVHWIQKGNFTRPVIIFTIGLVCLSSIALIVWAVWIKEDLSRYTAFIPILPLPMLLLYGLAFPLFNSFFEEFISRAVLYDGFSAIWQSKTAVIIMQASVFALWHYPGFPGGAAGVIMVFCWSIMLGVIRLKARGMLPVLAAHYMADLTIALILFFMIILPGGFWI